MATDVIMPKVDMDQETGTVSQWLKNEGDEVKQGEIILEIETDKVAIEVEAPASGILSGILVGQGETVPIATTIAYILQPGEALPEGAKPAQPEEAKAPPRTAVQQTDWEVPVTPVARKMAAASRLDLTTVPGSGRNGKVTKKDVQAALTAPQPGGNGYGKVNATPAARRLAAQRGVVLESVIGGGPEGRVQAADVLAAAEAAANAPAVSAPVLTPSAAGDVVPLQGMRRTIAERLTASYQSIPHINFTVRVDMTRFNEARAKLNKRGEQDGRARVSATALLAKIVAQTLLRHPWLNSSYKEGEGAQGAEIHLFDEVNLGIAVALEDGLIVPVVRDAANKGVAAIAAEVSDLAQRAREGRLAPSEVRDGTFTISNLGPFGVEQFTAIINPPQAAILAVGATQPEVVPDENGEIVVRPVMRITLAADHRVVDGAVAAHFLSDLKAALEEPVLLLL
jgi:pyruvate dehydrogenase E2 component (dihydrolipoyllysine-residue acetyltransferase)